MIISDLSYLEDVSETSVVGGDSVSTSSYELTSVNGQVVNRTISGTPPTTQVLPGGHTLYSFPNPANPSIPLITLLLPS
jgi:hypothetical protein